MANSTADLYDEHYYRHYCGSLPYERSDAWLGFFGKVADRIIETIGPRTVLDAGCALGLLVECLRDRGVEAYGIDISEYAIGNVREDIRPFCWQGSITEPLPRRYDLIVSIEVLEHLPRAESERALANLCGFTDDFLFSSSPWDHRETTHFNVQPPEYWADHFLRQGLLRDVDHDASFITSWAARFRRQPVTLQRVVHDYERRFWPLWKENADLRSLVNELRGQINADERRKDALEAKVAEQAAREAALQAAERQLQDQLAAAERNHHGLAAELAALQERAAHLAVAAQSTGQHLSQIEQSISWRMVKTVVPPIERALPRDSVGGRLLIGALEASGQGLAHLRRWLRAKA